MVTEQQTSRNEKRRAEHLREAVENQTDRHTRTACLRGGRKGEQKEDQQSEAAEMKGKGRSETSEPEKKGSLLRDGPLGEQLQKKEGREIPDDDKSETEPERQHVGR